MLKSGRILGQFVDNIQVFFPGGDVQKFITGFYNFILIS